MKLNIAFTYHYVLFLGVALLLTPARFIRTREKAKEVKMEKTIQQPVAIESTSEVLHSEILFRY